MIEALLNISSRKRTANRLVEVIRKSLVQTICCERAFLGFISPQHRSCTQDSWPRLLACGTGSLYLRGRGATEFANSTSPAGLAATISKHETECGIRWRRGLQAVSPLDLRKVQADGNGKVHLDSFG